MCHSSGIYRCGYNSGRCFRINSYCDSLYQEVLFTLYILILTIAINVYSYLLKTFPVLLKTVGRALTNGVLVNKCPFSYFLSKIRLTKPLFHIWICTSIMTPSKAYMRICMTNKMTSICLL